METRTYDVEKNVVDDHWWFKARRELVLRTLVKYKSARDLRVIDLGASSGTNLRLLKKENFTNYCGLDISYYVARVCADDNLGNMIVADAASIPLPADYMDVVLATDILEHVEDDDKALAEIFRVLRPGGILILTTPAFQSLWGLQDEVSHHKRRYRLKSLKTLVAQSGLTIDKQYYFNFLLFLPIWLARQLIRIFDVKLESENQVNNRILNKLLYTIFYVDIYIAQFLHPPFGVSIFVLAHKSEN